MPEALDPAMLAKAKLIQARAGLVTRAPFLGTLALNLQVSLTDDENIPVAAISAKGVCLFNAAYLAQLPIEELRTILLHETLHLALDCFQRRGQRDHLVWNYAHDLAVNQLIQDAGDRLAVWPTIFQGLLEPPMRGLPAERIYDLLLDAWRLEKDNRPEPEDLVRRLRESRFDAAAGSAPVDAGQIRDRWSPEQLAAASHVMNKVDLCMEDLQHGWDSLTDQERQSLRQKWGEALISAAEQSSRRHGWGSLPGWAQKLLGPLLRPKLPWPQLLKSRIHGHLTGARRTFARPGRRGLGMGLTLPGRMKDRGLAGVFVDVSGSVDAQQLAAFLAEVEGILQEADQDCRLMTWDAAVQEDLYLERSSSLRQALDGRELRLQGGGGTDPRCVIEHLAENRGDHPLPHFGVLLTDGFVPWPRASEWPLPMLVVSTHDLPDPSLGYEALSLSEGIP